MRKLTDHIINPANDRVDITAMDAPGAGGAHHRYEVTGYNAEGNPSLNSEFGDDILGTVILFQNGPIAEAGVNGITQEALLAIVMDRLRCFQAGPFACRENDLALANVEQALHWLQQRTLARMRRGVEGRNIA